MFGHPDTKIPKDEYFTDDIISIFKEFLKVTFGSEILADAHVDEIVAMPY
jgi:hypothetical protein